MAARLRTHVLWMDVASSRAISTMKQESALVVRVSWMWYSQSLLSVATRRSQPFVRTIWPSWRPSALVNGGMRPTAGENFFTVGTGSMKCMRSVRGTMVAWLMLEWSGTLVLVPQRDLPGSVQAAAAWCASTREARQYIAILVFMVSVSPRPRYR